MVNDNSRVKVGKNVELVSLMASFIEEMRPGNRMRVTPLAKSLLLGTGGHPHVETVKGKLNEADVWKGLLGGVELVKNGDQVVEVHKLDERRGGDQLEVLQRSVDKVEAMLKVVINKSKKR